MDKKRKTITIFLLSTLILTIFFFNFIKKELIAPEDRGAFFVIVKLHKVQVLILPKIGPKKLKNYYYLRLVRVNIEDLLCVFLGLENLLNKLIVALLLFFRAMEKKGPSWSKNYEGIFREIAKVPGVLAFPIMPQGIRTGGIESPIQFVILGNTYEQLIEWKEIIKSEARKNPGLTSIQDDFDLNKPQLNVKIDQKKAADLGVSTEDIGSTIELIFGSKKLQTLQEMEKNIQLYYKEI